MEILDGDEVGFIRALGMIVANPNPEHVREARLTVGEHADFRDCLATSLSESALVCYAIRGRTAMAGGVSLLGITRFQIWMTTTADAPGNPRWLWRQSVRCLKAVDRIMGKGTVYWQEIPPDYTRGLEFVERLGFERKRTIRKKNTGAELVLVEREVPEWGS